MFKEVVSLAVIMSFIFNIIYVDHPNTTSYTVYFSLSLAAMAPFYLACHYWFLRREATEREENEDSWSVSAVRDLEAGIAEQQRELPADAVKGMMESDNAEESR